MSFTARIQWLWGDQVHGASAENVLGETRASRRLTTSGFAGPQNCRASCQNQFVLIPHNSEPAETCFRSARLKWTTSNGSQRLSGLICLPSINSACAGYIPPDFHWEAITPHQQRDSKI